MDQTKLLDYLNGELDHDGVSQVEAWVEATPENRTLLEQLYYTKFVGDRIAVMDSVNVEKSLSELKASIKKKECTVVSSPSLSWKRYVMPLAAFLTGIVFTIGISYMTMNRSSNYIVATAAGQRAQFVLPDGSKVWLNSSTQLAYKASFWSRQRQVDLAGEAYFEVARNEDAPFVVNSKNIKTQVLGTKFNVRARTAEERVVTTLLKGSVRVDLPGKEGESFILRPGQSLDVNTNTLTSELTESESARDVLLWINGKLTFEQKTLLEISQCLEKHFNIHLQFKDEQLKSERFTCEFVTDDNITEIISALALTKRFLYKIDGKQVYLSYRK